MHLILSLLCDKLVYVELWFLSSDIIKFAYVLVLVELKQVPFYFLVMKGFSPQEVGLLTQTSNTEDSVRMALPLVQKSRRPSVGIH